MAASKCQFTGSPGSRSRYIWTRKLFPKIKLEKIKIIAEKNFKVLLDTSGDSYKNFQFQSSSSIDLECLLKIKITQIFTYGYNMFFLYSKAFPSIWFSISYDSRSLAPLQQILRSQKRFFQFFGVYESAMISKPCMLNLEKLKLKIKKSNHDFDSQ